VRRAERQEKLLRSGSGRNWEETVDANLKPLTRHLHVATGGKHETHKKGSVRAESSRIRSRNANPHTATFGSRFWL